MNGRPLLVRGTPDGDFIAIYPRDVLLGRAAKSRKAFDSDLEKAEEMEDDERIQLMEDDQSRIVSEWREKWLAQVFIHMVPRTKWRTMERYLAVGDISHVHYDQKLGPHSWRLAQVLDVKCEA